MCTAINFENVDNYFGRTLDSEIDFGEEVILTPRNFPLEFFSGDFAAKHFAFIGSARLEEGVPLYFDGMNERGLGGAALSFKDFSKYFPFDEGKKNIASYEVISKALALCGNLSDVHSLFSGGNIVSAAFSESTPPAPLHWIFSYKNESVVIESTERGLKLFENRANVLTNSPPFPFHRDNLLLYENLSPRESEKSTVPYFGSSALGLPGDWSSPSRFIRGAYLKRYAGGGKNEKERAGIFFEILSSLSVPSGAAQTKKGEEIFTSYSCCCNSSKGIYYYKKRFAEEIKKLTFDEFDLNEKTLFIL